MLWAPPESMTSASPRRMISVASPTAWLLAAQAVRQLKFGPSAPNMRGHVGGRHVRLLFELELRVEPLEAFLDERGQVELAVLEGGDHHVAEVVEILLAFAGAEVDAEAIGIDGARERPTSSTACLAAPMANFVCRPRFSHVGRVFADVGERPVADLGRDARGEVAGVEERRVADARLGFLEIGPQLRAPSCRAA